MKIVVVLALRYKIKLSCWFSCCCVIAIYCHWSWLDCLFVGRVAIIHAQLIISCALCPSICAVRKLNYEYHILMSVFNCCFCWPISFSEFLFQVKLNFYLEKWINFHMLIFFLVVNKLNHFKFNFYNLEFYENQRRGLISREDFWRGFVKTLMHIEESDDVSNTLEILVCGIDCAQSSDCNLDFSWWNLLRLFLLLLFLK